MEDVRKNQFLKISDNNQNLVSMNHRQLLLAGIIACLLSGIFAAKEDYFSLIGVIGGLFALVFIGRQFFILCVLVSLIGFEAVNTLYRGESYYSLTVIKIVGLMLLISVIPSIVMGKVKVKLSNGTLILTFLLIGLILSLLKSENYSASIRELLTFFQLAVLWLIVRYLVNTEKKLTILSIFAVISLSISALIGISQYVLTPDSRITGISQNAAILSADLFVGFWLCFALYKRTNIFRSKIFWGIFLLILTVGLLVTLSRAAYIAIIPSFIVVGLCLGKTRKAMFLLIIFIICILIFAPFTIERLSETSVIKDTATKGHLLSIKAGLNIMLDNPLLGVGIGNYDLHYLRYTNDIRMIPRTAHNSYLAIGSEAGIFTMLLFIIFHILAFVSLWKTAKKQNDEGNINNLYFIAAVAGALTVFCIIGLFHALQIQKYLWILLALAGKFPEKNVLSDK